MNVFVNCVFFFNFWCIECCALHSWLLMLVDNSCQSVSILSRPKDTSQNAFSQPVRILKRQPVSDPCLVASISRKYDFCCHCYEHSFHTTFLYCFNLRIKCSFSLPSITNVKAVTVKLFQKVAWVRVYLGHDVVYIYTWLLWIRLIFSCEEWTVIAEKNASASASYS